MIKVYTQETFKNVVLKESEYVGTSIDSKLIAVITFDEIERNMEMFLGGEEEDYNNSRSMQDEFLDDLEAELNIQDNLD